MRKVLIRIKDLFIFIWYIPLLLITPAIYYKIPDEKKR